MPSKTIFWFLAITGGLAWLLLAAGALGLGQAQSNPRVPTVTGWPTRTATVTPTSTLPGTITVTPTPTSHPGVPQLVEPEDGGLMPQPLPPNGWYFSWYARNGPCYCTLGVSGPGGRGFYVEVDYALTTDTLYHYQYIGEYIPDDALGPWHWSVSVICPLGSNHSETRTFFVETYLTPTPTTEVTTTDTPTDTPTNTPTDTPTNTPTNTLTNIPTRTLPPATITPTPTLTEPPAFTPTKTPPPVSPDYFVHLPLVSKEEER